MAIKEHKMKKNEQQTSRPLCSSTANLASSSISKLLLTFPTSLILPNMATAPELWYSSSRTSRMQAVAQTGLAVSPLLNIRTSSSTSSAAATPVSDSIVYVTFAQSSRMPNRIYIRFVPKKTSPVYRERNQKTEFKDYGSQNLDFLPSHAIPVPLLSLRASNPSLSLSLSLSRLSLPPAS